MININFINILCSQAMCMIIYFNFKCADNELKNLIVGTIFFYHQGFNILLKMYFIKSNNRFLILVNYFKIFFIIYFFITIIYVTLC